VRHPVRVTARRALQSTNFAFRSPYSEKERREAGKAASRVHAAASGEGWFRDNEYSEQKPFAGLQARLVPAHRDELMQLRETLRVR
jgi:hypothetical protein